LRLSLAKSAFRPKSDIRQRLPTNSIYKYTAWIKGVFAGLKGA
jgi:hypothetical protein